MARRVPQDTLGEVGEGGRKVTACSANRSHLFGVLDTSIRKDVIEGNDG